MTALVSTARAVPSPPREANWFGNCQLPTATSTTTPALSGQVKGDPRPPNWTVPDSLPGRGRCPHSATTGYPGDGIRSTPFRVVEVPASVRAGQVKLGTL